MTQTLDIIDSQAIADFNTHGVTIVRGLFSPDEVALIERGIERNLADPSPMFKVASRADDPGSFVEDFCNWQRIEEFGRVAFESRAADVAGALMGSRQVRLYHDHMLVKEPGTRQDTPWHQDQPYYDVDGRDVISMWLPVDAVPRASTLEFVAGTHLGPWLMPRTFMQSEAKWFPEGSLTEAPDVQANRSAFPILGWELQPGDTVFFHALTLHAAQGATGRRRVVSIRYLGDDAHRVERPWRCSPPMPADATFPDLLAK